MAKHKPSKRSSGSAPAARFAARPGHRQSRPRTAQESSFVRSIGASIRSRRIAAKMTASELAAVLNVTITTQYRRESGAVSLPTEELLRYAEALRCNPAELLGG